LGEFAPMKALLDTHVLLWWLGAPDQLSPEQRQVIGSADADTPLLVSDISLWEVAMLRSLGRIHLTIPLREWLEKAVAPPLVRRQGISPAIAAEVAALPDSFHRDPADRILVATARVLGATLLTRDRRIVAAALTDTLS
jgi:PIN domain nuclease of toxin-antitoxin system